MASVNKVFLIGNLTRDPELRYTPAGNAVTDLGVATNRYYTTKDGERREEPTFIDVTVWNRQAETCCQYLKKGQPVHVEGYLKMDTWDDRTTGEKRSKLKVEAERVQFLGSKRDDGGASMPDEDYAPAAREPRRAEPRAAGNGPNRGGPQAPPPPSSQPARRPAHAAPADSGEDEEDIPF